MIGVVIGLIGVVWSAAVFCRTKDQIRRFFSFYALVGAIAVMFSDPMRPPGSWGVLVLVLFATLDLGDRYMKRLCEPKA